ncbi:hypothetical protein [Flavicella sp.]|uniref:DUF6913 domain-containing protein n=1 Tax=Flavicella sp. TaxID=2957742 RepID=UPI0030165F84
MLSKLKKKSIAKRYQKDKLNQKYSIENRNRKVIKTIAILMEESQLLKSNPTLNSLQQEFKIPIENIHLIVFKNFKKGVVYTDFELTRNDFGWHGSLKSNKLQEFVKNEYDLLINYGFEENLYWNVITLHSLSNFKVGFTSKENRLYDLSISDTERNLDVLTDEMIKYLKILKKL